ncbi:MAG TPA: RNA polymerase sigma factor [bacterium]|nr:RNA polymerase sigma factor [bacterium]
MKRSESSLVRKSKSGNSHAYGMLVRKYQAQILSLAYDLSGNYEDAQDLAQEAFIRAYERLPQFKEQSRFSTWLYRITVNLVMDFHRTRQRTTVESLQSMAYKLPADADSSAYITDRTHRVARELRNEKIEAALAELTDHQRLAVVLKYFHEKSSPEIAEIMECSAATARTHIFRGLQKLKKLLQAEDARE